MARPRFDFASIRLALVAFAVTCVSEFLLMSAIDALGYVRGGGVFGGLVDGLLMGVIVGGFYLLTKSFSGREDARPGPALFMNAAVLGIVTLCFETALHVAIEEAGAGKEAVLVALANAAALGAIVAAAAAWLDLIERDVADHGGVRPAERSAHGVLILSGAVLMAVCVSVVPLVLIGTTARTLERTEGIAELVQLTGRQRTLSQRVVLVTHQPSPARHEELHANVDTMVAELGRIETLSRRLLRSEAERRDRGVSGASLAELASLRTRLLADAEAVFAAKTPRAQARALERFDDSARAYLPVLNAAAGRIERLAEQKLADQSATTAALAIITPIMIFGLALAML